MNNKHDLTEGKVFNKIILFAAPMLLGNIFQQLYNVVDAYVVGNTPNGDELLAAVGTSFPILFLLIALAMGFSMGGNVLVAQYVGAGDTENVKKTVATQYVLAVVGAVLLTIIGLLTASPILKLLGTPDNVFPHALTYLNIFYIGLLPMFGYNVVSAILRGLGDSKTPTVFIVVATIVNIGLDMLFVWVFDWGVAGVAWATVIAQGLSFVLSVVYLIKKNSIIMLKLSEIRFDMEIFKQTVRIGVPSSLQQVTMSVGFMFIQGKINSFGSDVMSGFAAAVRVEGFAIMPFMNIAMATSAFVGQNIGANKWDRVKEGIRVTVISSLVFAAVISLFVILFGQTLVGLFNQKPEVIAVGNDYLLYTAPFYVMGAYIFAMGGVFRGAGDALAAALIAIIAFWVIRLPAAYILSSDSFNLGYLGIIIAQPIGWAASVVITFVYDKTGRWKKKAVVKTEK